MFEESKFWKSRADTHFGNCCESFSVGVSAAVGSSWRGVWEVCGKVGAEVIPAQRNCSERRYHSRRLESSSHPQCPWVQQPHTPSMSEKGHSKALLLIQPSPTHCKRLHLNYWETGNRSRCMCNSHPCQVLQRCGMGKPEVYIWQSGALIAWAHKDQEQGRPRVAARFQMQPLPWDSCLPLCSICLFVWAVSLVLNCWLHSRAELRGESIILQNCIFQFRLSTSWLPPNLKLEMNYYGYICTCNHLGG